MIQNTLTFMVMKLQKPDEGKNCKKREERCLKSKTILRKLNKLHAEPRRYENLGYSWTDNSDIPYNNDSFFS